ncbi:MAG: indole-3-glycerol phosphate synthase TrpC [Chloroflexota bacterium]|nr:indole-3-glycerol phosphate synthase TrpC [Chloroflexota bacterium]PLS77540.1 MAG: indole-3-glycerol phosphate synthase TrpC [Chloroflexota bacterium]
MTQPTYLDRILEHKRAEVARQKLKVPLAELQERAAAAWPVRPFSVVLRQPQRLALIAEVKHKSPSKGILVPDFDPLKLARTYIEHGADALSILTDVRFFGGSLQYLKAIRELEQRLPERGDVPLLRKDFILEPYQVYEARAYGADALLLIVAALDDAELRHLLDLTEQLGMEALVEVHDAAELERALTAGATTVGVNNRDLRTFAVDVGTTGRLAELLPQCERPVLVSESGIQQAEDLGRLRGWKADAILVGEAIVTAPNIGVKVRELSGRAVSISGSASAETIV